MFLVFRKDAGFLEALESQNRGRLDLWFDSKLSLARLHWCLTPFKKCTDMDFILHMAVRPNREQETIHNRLQSWSRLLCSSTAADIYQFVVQMKAEWEEPRKNWMAVRTNLEALPGGQEGQAYKVRWGQLPASPEHGRYRRMDNRPRIDTSINPAILSRPAMPDVSEDIY